jgi:hypothetical protein
MTKILEQGPPEQIFTSPGHPHTGSSSSLSSPRAASSPAASRYPIVPSKAICQKNSRCEQGEWLSTAWQTLFAGGLDVRHPVSAYLATSEARKDA